MRTYQIKCKSMSRNMSGQLALQEDPRKDEMIRITDKKKNLFVKYEME